MPSRIDISCGESADIQRAVWLSVEALWRTGALDEIPEVVGRLHTEAGWPLNVVKELTDLALTGELWGGDG